LRPHEWPLVAGAVATVRGQAALLGGDLPTAQALLEAAVVEHAHYPAPAFYADPRIALAHLRRLRGDARGAGDLLQGLLSEIERDATPGRLLLEPPAIVLGLLESVSHAGAHAGIVAELRRRVQQAQATEAMGDAPSVPASGLSPIAVRLTEREREVMALVARGLSNKHLARELSLSAHTVKRHLANILDKLDCDNRVQAAHLWRAGEG